MHIAVGAGNTGAGGDISVASSQSTTSTGGGVWIMSGYGSSTSSGAILFEYIECWVIWCQWCFVSVEWWCVSGGKVHLEQYGLDLDHQ